MGDSFNILFGTRTVVSLVFFRISMTPVTPHLATPVPFIWAMGVHVVLFCRVFCGQSEWDDPVPVQIASGVRTQRGRHSTTLIRRRWFESVEHIHTQCNSFWSESGVIYRNDMDSPLDTISSVLSLPISFLS